MKSDVRGKYGWVELEETHLQFVSLILSAHSSFRLYITSFDSGAISPTEEEREKGWKSQGGVMVSPKLEQGTIVPYDNFDEWYFFEEAVVFPAEHEVFVNYGGFSLVPVEKQLKDFDPSWERVAMESLRSAQERFWAQVTRFDPATYVSMGDRNIVVSKNRGLLERIRESA